MGTQNLSFYLGGKKSRQVDFGHHLVSSIFTFALLVRLHLKIIQVKKLHLSQESFTDQWVSRLTFVWHWVRCE